MSHPEPQKRPYERLTDPEKRFAEEIFQSINTENRIRKATRAFNPPLNMGEPAARFADHLAEWIIESREPASPWVGKRVRVYAAGPDMDHFHPHVDITGVTVAIIPANVPPNSEQCRVFKIPEQIARVDRMVILRDEFKDSHFIFPMTTRYKITPLSL